MPNITLEDVKRMIDIENALMEIKNNNIEIKKTTYIEVVNLVVELCGDLDIKDMEYIDLAIKLPFKEIEKFYNAYKLNKDKITETELINYLINKYDIDKFFIIKRLDQIQRIKNVERLELHNKVNREEKNKKTKGGK